THLCFYLLKLASICSNEPSTRTRLSAFIMSYVFNNELITVFVRGTFREDKYTFLFVLSNTNKDFLLSKPKVVNRLTNSLVFGVSKSRPSKTIIFFFEAFKLKADLRASRLTFLFNCCE